MTYVFSCFVPPAYGASRPSEVTASELNSLLSQNRVKVVDTRAYMDYSISHIGGALSLPARYLGTRMSELNSYGNILLITEDAKEEKAVIGQIRKAYPKKTIILLKGGINDWFDAGYHVDNDLPHGC